MAQTWSRYWRMIWAKAWTAAWSRARSWSALRLIGVGIISVYFAVPNDLRARLASLIPLILVVILLFVFIPMAIYQSYSELQRKLGASGDELVGKWFHTLNAENQIQFQGKVLENRNGRFFI